MIIDKGNQIITKVCEYNTHLYAHSNRHVLADSCLINKLCTFFVLKTETFLSGNSSYSNFPLALTGPDLSTCCTSLVQTHFKLQLRCLIPHISGNWFLVFVISWNFWRWQTKLCKINGSVKTGSSFYADIWLFLLHGKLLMAFCDDLAVWVLRMCL